MSIRAFQVNNGLVTPLADRTLYSFLTGGMVGVMGEGCSCTYVNINTVHISSGWGVIMGCLFQVTQEDLIIDYGTQTSFPVSCRVGIRLNVSAAGTEQDPNAEIFYDFSNAGPRRDDINNGGSIYEIILTTFSITANGIDSSTFTPIGASRISGPDMKYLLGPNTDINDTPYVTLGNIFDDGLGGNASLSLEMVGNVPSDYKKIDLFDKVGNFLPSIGLNVGPLSGQTDIPNKTVNSGTSYTTLGNFNIPQAGRYIIFVTCRFASNSTGYRSVGISPGSDSMEPTLIQQKNVSAVNGAYTFVDLCIPIDVPTNNFKIYVKAAQNSGSALTVLTRYTAIRVNEIPRTGWIYD